MDCTPDNPCNDIDNCRCVNLGPVCDPEDTGAVFIDETCQTCGWSRDDHQMD